MCIHAQKRDAPGQHSREIEDVAGTDRADVRLSPETVANAIRLLRAGYSRREIVRSTGMTADQVSELIELERPTAPADRCNQTEDLFG